MCCLDLPLSSFLHPLMCPTLWMELFTTRAALRPNFTREVPFLLSHHRYDVDPDLWEVLDLCSDQELEEVHNILTNPHPFGPLVKSLVLDREPPAVAYTGRVSLMHRIDSKFR